MTPANGAVPERRVIHGMPYRYRRNSENLTQARSRGDIDLDIEVSRDKQGRRITEALAHRQGARSSEVKARCPPN
jgi:hypothetical protein